jgi:hypothetical protein
MRGARDDKKGINEVGMCKKKSNKKQTKHID